MNWQFRIIAVGRLKDRMLEERVATYAARLGAWAKVEITELADGSVESEGQAILKLLEKERTSRIVILSEEGRQLTSAGFAEYLRVADRRIVLVLGGAMGLSAEVRKSGDLLLSLSCMTFTHEMARWLLVEQLYRAATIVHGGKYHHA